MSGLILKLGPRERVLINGAVIENGDKRSRLAICPSSYKVGHQIGLSTGGSGSFV
ncbi:hypothetical protein DSM117340_03311 [Lentibacter algarum]